MEEQKLSILAIKKMYRYIIYRIVYRLHYTVQCKKVNLVRNTPHSSLWSDMHIDQDTLSPIPKMTVLGLAPKYTSLNGNNYQQSVMALAL